MANNEREPLLTSINSNPNYNNYSSNDIYESREPVLYASSSAINTPKHLISGVVVLILVLMERIAFYSLTGNLYLFLTQSDFNWMYYNAINALLIFTGTSYLSSLLGGWLSDAYLGRYKTIFFAFILFSVAYWFLPFMPQLCNLCTDCFLPITPDDEPEVKLYSENCSWTVMAILIIAAIGTGTVKANITPFGAEQVKYSGQDGLRLYLNWLYWCVNIGALIAILGITYVQQVDGFKSGYLIPVCLLTVATIMFLVTYPIYTHQSSCGSSISRTFSVLKGAWKLNRIRKRNVTMESQTSVESINRPTWLDMAKVRYGGKFHDSVVEDVKSLSVIITVFLSLIPYWMLYFQMQTTFLAQGLQMRLSILPVNSTADVKDATEFSIPAAWLMLFNVLFLIIFIPLMNHVIYPWLDRRGTQISILTRMAIGMMCATLSMVIAGCLEICRLHFIHEGRIVNQTIENTVFVAADLPIMWQIPQYSLIGISEVFTSVSGMEFACSQAPTLCKVL
nr:solute carrier family 15 member 4-like [Parasteatoda tepidariorum]